MNCLSSSANSSIVVLCTNKYIFVIYPVKLIIHQMKKKSVPKYKVNTLDSFTKKYAYAGKK